MEKITSLYSKIGVPRPTLSPEERYRRRLAWRNERVFYRRKCDKTGRSMISIFSEDKPFPVYFQDVWWSDVWDAKDYGRDYDFVRPFFVQFRELFNVVPQRSLNAFASENSEYTNQCEYNKNCYLVISSGRCEDCSYCMWAEGSRDCMDCLYVEQCELCYQLSSGKLCYECTFSSVLSNCTACHFCQSCIGCTNCYGCINLRNKQYCFLNEQLSKDEYLKKIANLKLHTRSGIQKAKEIAEAEFKQIPHKYYIGSNIENSTGDYIQETKDSDNIFNCRHVEQVFFSQDAWRAHHCLDLTETIDNEFSLELEGCGLTVNCGYSMKLNACNNVWYSSHCSSSQDLFGCVGMRNDKYAILNRQYSADEFQQLKSKIIVQMKSTGEFGEHFPIALSPFGYNETVAAEYFPLSKADVLAQKWNWQDEVISASTSGTITPESPDDPKLLEEIYSCAATKKAFRIIAAEKLFYQKLNLPVPTFCPDERHRRRMVQRNPRKLTVKNCTNCQIAISTAFQDESSFKIYCERCYLNVVE